MKKNLTYGPRLPFRQCGFEFTAEKRAEFKYPILKKKKQIYVYGGGLVNGCYEQSPGHYEAHQTFKAIAIAQLFIAIIIATSFTSCMDVPQDPPIQSASGVAKASVKVKTDMNGNTSEQMNIIGRYEEDNKPGSIKHLYILSSYSGQVLIYSTVRGKVTSSGKRLNPTTVNSHDGTSAIGISMNTIEINGHTYSTDEVIQDDGTYGSSVEYIFWWDSKGVYHQQYITGGMILHVSNQPMSVKSVVINMEEKTIN